MKKLLVLVLTTVLLLASLPACNSIAKGVTVEQGDVYTKITFDNFQGRKTISIPHDSPNEGALYYKTDLTNGSMQATYDLGILWDTEKLFEASADNNSIGPGYYIDSSISKITVTFEADMPVTGEVILSFKPIGE